MTSLIILGAGGHGKVVAETAIASGIFKKIAFLDDRYSNKNHPLEKFHNLEIIGNLSSSIDKDISLSYSHAVVALGNNKLRISWLEKLLKKKYILPTLIHPTAWVSPSAVINSGTVIFAKVVVQANAKIGFGTILNTGSVIEHDVVLESGVHICPSASLAGGVLVGKRSMVGLGSSVIQNIIIGSDVNLGAGSTVIKNLPNKITAIGSPAKILSKGKIV